MWKTNQVRRRFLVEAQQIGLRLKRLKNILHVAEEIGRIEVTADMPPRDIVERLQDLQQRARTAEFGGSVFGYHKSYVLQQD